MKVISLVDRVSESLSLESQLPLLWVNPSVHSVWLCAHQTHFSLSQSISGNS